MSVSLTVIGIFLVFFLLTGFVGGIANIIVLGYGLHLVRRKDIQAIKVLLITVLAVYTFLVLYSLVS